MRIYSGLGESFLGLQNRQCKWFVTKVYPVVSGDVGLSSCNISSMNENSGKGPEVIIFFFGRSRLETDKGTSENNFILCFGRDRGRGENVQSERP